MSWRWNINMKAKQQCWHFSDFTPYSFNYAFIYRPQWDELWHLTNGISPRKSVAWLLKQTLPYFVNFSTFFFLSAESSPNVKPENPRIFFFNSKACTIEHWTVSKSFYIQYTASQFCSSNLKTETWRKYTKFNTYFRTIKSCTPDYNMRIRNISQQF